MKESQLQFVVKVLKENGRITRNFCLKNRITRLSALIYDLRKSGWNLEAKNEHTFGGYGRGIDRVYIWRDWKPIHTQSVQLQEKVLR